VIDIAVHSLKSPAKLEISVPIICRRSFSGLGILTAAVAQHGLAATAPAERPNVIFFLVDDLGWADLSCYGSRFHETPNLDRLAREGMRFTRAYSSSPYCSPSRAAIMTGRHPARLKITDFIPSNGKSGKFLPAEMRHELPLEEVTIAEVLKDANYATWHVGKWHLGETEFFPEHQGFDINIAGNGSGVPGDYFWPYARKSELAMPPEKLTGTATLAEGGSPGEHLCDRLTGEAMKLIENRKPDRPFFLYLAFYDVHAPIVAKPELVKKYQAKAAKLGLPVGKAVPAYEEGRIAHGTDRLRKLPECQANPIYAAMIETMDTNVGRVMDKLNELGIADNTLILFTSDNGGHLVTCNRPLRGCKGWLYEGGVREPWIVKWPGITKPGSTCDVPVMNTDIFPTILEAAGQPAQPELHKDGTSFVSLLKGGTKPVHDALFWHFPHYGNHGSGPCSSVLVGDWKLIHWIENDSVELFNIAEDIGETTDLSAKHPERAAELRARIEHWRKETNANMPRTKP
jgi:arylsulfatase A-like enzyme